jgi:hypothetical protein
MIEPRKLQAMASELRERAEEVRNRAETITDENMRMQMLDMAASYEKKAADLTARALKQVLRR